MNNITIEFCPEDRARIDRLIEAMEKKACEKCVENALAAMSVAHEYAQPVAPSQPATPVHPTAQAVHTPQPVGVPPQQPAIPYASPAPVATPVQPVAPTAPVIPDAPVPSATPTAPTVAIPTGTVAYDMDTIARAGSALIDQNPANIGKLMALLAKYGTNAITTLDPAHYGAFATELRALGAAI